MKSKIILFYYFILLTIEIIAEVYFSYTKDPTLMFVTKPLLMPILIVWAFLFSKEHSIPLNTYLISALIFSMFGDIALMFVVFKPQVFILGLTFFLLTHIIYIVLFLKSPFNNFPSLLKNNPLVVILSFIYAISFIAFLYQQNSLQFIEMQLPVILYTLIILIMLLVAFSVFKKNNSGLLLIIIGAFLFVLSDSTIALHNFSSIFDNNTNLAKFIIMSLYGIAQFMIVKGYLMSTISYKQKIHTT